MYIFKVMGRAGVRLLSSAALLAGVQAAGIDLTNEQELRAQGGRPLGLAVRIGVFPPHGCSVSPGGRHEGRNKKQLGLAVFLSDVN